MAKASIDTGQTAQPVHTRTTAGAEESQASVLCVDGSDAAVATPQLGTGEFVVAIAGGLYATTSGTITTTSSTVTSGDIGRAGNVTIGIFGTYAGVNASFEASPDGGTTWFAVGCTREDTGINEAATGVLPSNQTRMWTTGAPGFNRIRVRATAWTSGTANVVILPGAMPFEPLTAVVPPRPRTATVTSPTIAAANTNTTLLAANDARIGATLINDIAGNLLVKLGATSSATSFTVRLAGRYAYYEVPAGYAGIIDGQWDVANGIARVTELT